jgi:epsilon-lactone hydrolase
MPSRQHDDVLEHLRSIGAMFAGTASDAPPYQGVRLAMEALFTAPALDSCEVTAAAAAGRPAEWIVDRDCNGGRRILFLHGGGYIAGSITSHRNLAMWISKATGCAVLLIDYRLAPEHPFPAAVEDAKDAFLWMRNNGPGQADRAERAFVLGDSAGGGLALSLLLALRNQHEMQADAAVTFSAWTDVSNSSPSMKNNQNPAIGAIKSVVDYFTAEYMQGGDPKQALASPVYADLAGLPPLLLQISDSELVSDDSTRFAEKAKAAGVSVRLETWAGVVHVFQGFVPDLPEAVEAIKSVGRFLRGI